MCFKRLMVVVILKHFFINHFCIGASYCFFFVCRKLLCQIWLRAKRKQNARNRKRDRERKKAHTQTNFKLIFVCFFHFTSGKIYVWHLMNTHHRHFIYLVFLRAHTHSLFESKVCILYLMRNLPLHFKI